MTVACDLTNVDLCCRAAHTKDVSQSWTYTYTNAAVLKSTWGKKSVLTSAVPVNRRWKQRQRWREGGIFIEREKGLCCAPWKHLEFNAEIVYFIVRVISLKHSFNFTLVAYINSLSALRSEKGSSFHCSLCGDLGRKEKKIPGCIMGCQSRKKEDPCMSSF